MCVGNEKTGDARTLWETIGKNWGTCFRGNEFIRPRGREKKLESENPTDERWEHRKEKSSGKKEGSPGSITSTRENWWEADRKEGGVVTGKVIFEHSSRRHPKNQ